MMMMILKMMKEKKKRKKRKRKQRRCLVGDARFVSERFGYFSNVAVVKKILHGQWEHEYDILPFSAHSRFLFR